MRSPALLLTLASLPVLAQSNALLLDPSGRGLLFPPTNAALVDDATALRVNPAALSKVGALELFYAHEWRNQLAQRSGSDGLYGATRLGPLGYGGAGEWTSGGGVVDQRRLIFGTGMGGET